MKYKSWTPTTGHPPGTAAHAVLKNAVIRWAVETHVFMSGEVVLETVPKSWKRPVDMKTVSGFLVVGVRRLDSLRGTTYRAAGFAKPIVVLP